MQCWFSNKFFNNHYDEEYSNTHEDVHNRFVPRKPRNMEIYIIHNPQENNLKEIIKE